MAYRALSLARAPIFSSVRCYSVHSANSKFGQREAHLKEEILKEVDARDPAKLVSPAVKQFLAEVNGIDRTVSLNKIKVDPRKVPNLPTEAEVKRVVY